MKTAHGRIGRRAVTGIAALLAALTAGGAGAVASAAPASPTGSKPAFYLEVRDGKALVRSTATGALTSKVRCPERGETMQFDIAAAHHETFFLDCQRFVKRGGVLVIQTNIHRLELTRNGHVRMLSLVHDGSLTRFSANLIAASSDGTELAVQGQRDPFGASPAEVYVINTAKRTRALWTEGSWRPSTVVIGSVSFTGDGRELTFLAHHFCPATSTCQHYSDVRVIHPSAHGGQLSKAAVLLSLSTVAPDASSEVDDAIINADGSALTLVIDRLPGSASASGKITVIKVAVTSGRQIAVLYRPHDVDLGPFQRFASVDPSVRQLLIGYQANGTISGWLTGGKIIPLRGQSKNATYLAW